MIKLKVSIKTQRSPNIYPVFIGEGLLHNLPEYHHSINKYNRVIIITDNQGKRLFGNQLLKNLRAKKIKSFLLAFPAGEQHKNQKTVSDLQSAMLDHRCGRDTLILALGGGVVGDLAGFVAATYMRGIDYIQIPTTLLAMVDSSIGGKTGIDTARGKNLIGAVWQPKAVIMDVDCLNSLPQKQIVNGLVEAVKMFMTSDKGSFDYALKHLSAIRRRQTSALTEIIKRAVKIKTGIIGRDETENHERMTLNFGHTIGHALEKLSNYRLMHGFAVALGVLVEAKISSSLGILTPSDYGKIVGMMKHLGIDQKQIGKWNINNLIAQTKSDKKSRSGKARYVLLERIGKINKKNGAYAHFVDDRIIKASLKI